MKVGDRVRIKDTVDETRYRRHVVGWTDEMLDEIGKIGTIRAFCPDGIDTTPIDEEGDKSPTYIVDHDLGDIFYWFPEDLEVIGEEKKEEDNMNTNPTVGDVVNGEWEIIAAKRYSLLPDDNFLFIVLCVNPTNYATPYVVWLYNRNDYAYYDGDYVPFLEEALLAFDKRGDISIKAFM